MRDAPFVLVPPSQSKTPGGTGRCSPGSGAFRGLAPSRREVASALGQLLDGEPDRVAKVLGATGPLLDQAIDATARITGGTARGLPAARRYDGVVWAHLEADDLDPDQLGRLLVPSAVTGLSAGTDPVPDHRLTFGVALPGIGRLDRWWRPALTSALLRHVGDGTVVDLLPNEHAAAFDMEALAADTDLVRVRFVSADGGRAVGHAAKAVKGRVARAALTGGIRALGRFSWEGWRTTRTATGYDVVAPA
jgi:uncharacterized protein